MSANSAAILDLLEKSCTHPTAEEIYLQLKAMGVKITLATVYNNLHLLLEQDRIRCITVPGSPDRYDRCHKHDHTVCKRCGRISDIVLEDFTPLLQETVGSGFISYGIQIRCICPECQSGASTDGQGSRQL